MTIEEITQGLTEAQRTGLVAGGEMHPDDLFALAERGLLYRDEPKDTEEYYAFEPTELGTAVRTHLEREGHED
jgi:hypothetical protein